MIEDRRKWFRCKVPERDQSATLRIKSQDIQVRLVTTSIAGLSAVYSGSLQVQPGDLLLLQTRAGWTEVRVVRLDTQGDATHVGLERVRDLGDRLQQHWVDYLGGKVAVAVLAVALIAGVAAGVAATQWWKGGSADSPPSQAVDRPTADRESSHGKDQSKSKA